MRVIARRGQPLVLVAGTAPMRADRHALSRSGHGVWPAAIGDRDQRVKRQSAKQKIASTGQSYETDTYSLQNRVSISADVRALLRWAPTGITRTLLGNDVVPIHHPRDIAPVFGV